MRNYRHSVLATLVTMVLAGCRDGSSGRGCPETGPCPDGGLDGVLAVRGPRGTDTGDLGDIDLASAADGTSDVSGVDAGEEVADAASSDLRPSSDIPTAEAALAEGLDAVVTILDASSPEDVPIDSGIDVVAPEDVVTSAETSRDACLGPAYLPGQPRGATEFKDGTSFGLLGGQAVPVWGELDSVTGPVCIPGDYVPDADRSCSDHLSWGPGPALCLSGKVPAVPAARLGTSWGLGIGIPAGCAGEVGQDFATVSAVLAGVPTAAVRAGRFLLAAAVREGGSSALYYAADDGTGATHDLTTFNTEWWAPAEGTYLLPSQVRHVVMFYVLVASSTADSFVVDDLCLSRMTFN